MPQAIDCGVPETQHWDTRKKYKIAKMNLIELTAICNGPILEMIRWLQGQNLLGNPLRCSPCNQAMEVVQRDQNHVDGYLW